MKSTLGMSMSGSEGRPTIRMHLIPQTVHVKIVKMQNTIFILPQEKNVKN